MVSVDFAPNDHLNVGVMALLKDAIESGPEALNHLAVLHLDFPLNGNRHDATRKSATNKLPTVGAR